MRHIHKTITAAFAVLVLAGCDPDEDVTDRKLIIETASGDDGGGGDTGTTGDEAEWEFEVGEPQVCEVPNSELQFALPATRDDLTDAAEPTLAAVACPKAGVGVAKYVDYRCEARPWDGAGLLYCQYFCDCTVNYASPCNPPHADCGGAHESSTALEINTATFPWGVTPCNTAGWAHCRLGITEAAQRCANWCSNTSPDRTRDCPDCPK